MTDDTTRQQRIVHMIQVGNMDIIINYEGLMWFWGMKARTGTGFLSHGHVRTFEHARDNGLLAARFLAEGIMRDLVHVHKACKPEDIVWDASKEITRLRARLRELEQPDVAAVYAYEAGIEEGLKRTKEETTNE
jgi:hypothetical protein